MGWKRWAACGSARASGRAARRERHVPFARSTCWQFRDLLCHRAKCPRRSNAPQGNCSRTCWSQEDMFHTRIATWTSKDRSLDRVYLKSNTLQPSEKCVCLPGATSSAILPKQHERCVGWQQKLLLRSNGLSAFRILRSCRKRTRKGRVSIEVRAQNSFRTVPRKDASNKRMRLCRGRDFEHAHGIEIHFQVMRTWLLRFIMLCSIKCPCSLLAVLYESALFPCSKGFDEQHGSSATSMGFAIEGFSMACVIVLPTSMQKWTLLDSTRDSSATPHALQGVKKVFRNNKDDEEFEEVRSYCNCKKTWRTKGSFQHTLPCALSVEQLVKGLYWFAPNIPLTTVQKEIGLTLKSLRELYYQIRLVMFSAALPKLGGLRRIVVVDETYFTRRKRCKGGLGGRVTWGMKVSLLGMVELDMNTRKETGNIRLTIIPWTNRYHLQKIFWNTSRTNTKRICGFTEAWSSIKFTLLVPARSDVAIHAHRAAPEDSDYELVHASGGHL